MDVEKQSLVAKQDNRVTHILGALIGLLVFLAVIFSGMTLSKVSSSGFCTSDTTYVTSTSTFESMTSTSVAAPTCGQTCQAVAKTNAGKAGAAYFVFDYLIGEVRSVYDVMTGNNTLYSNNLGNINSIEPLLCNLTSISNVTYTVFQYYPNSKALERVVTTLPQTNGIPATCTYMNVSGAAYKAVTAGNMYYGTSTLYGVSYSVVYGPLYDAVTKAFIGSLFAGYV